MPIRFACEHCGQRLNVGEERAGARARCPKCGQPIRVPGGPGEVAARGETRRASDPASHANVSTGQARLGVLDGSLSASQVVAATTVPRGVAEAIPQAAAESPPGSPGGSQSVRSRTDELGRSAAKIARSHGAGVIASVGSATNETAQQEEIGEPSLANQPPGPPTAIAPESVWQEGADAGEPLYGEFIVYDEERIGEHGEAVETASATARSLLDRVAIPRAVLYAQGILLAVVGLAGFVLGVLFGATQEPAPEQAAVTELVTLSGWIRWQDAAAREQPDEGAVILAFPRDSRPEADQRLDIAGFRPGDPQPTEDHPALQTLYRLGGAVAWASPDGHFRLRLAAGDYYLLVLSRSVFRQSSQQPVREDLSQIGRYSKRATELLGSSAYRWQALALRRDQTLDVTF